MELTVIEIITKIGGFLYTHSSTISSIMLAVFAIISVAFFDKISDFFNFFDNNKSKFFILLCVIALSMIAAIDAGRHIQDKLNEQDAIEAIAYPDQKMRGANKTIATIANLKQELNEANKTIADFEQKLQVASETITNLDLKAKEAQEELTKNAETISNLINEVSKFKQ